MVRFIIHTPHGRVFRTRWYEADKEDAGKDLSRVMADRLSWSLETEHGRVVWLGAEFVVGCMVEIQVDE